MADLEKASGPEWLELRVSGKQWGQILQGFIIHAHTFGAHAEGSGETLKDLDMVRSFSLEILLRGGVEKNLKVCGKAWIVSLSPCMPKRKTAFPASLGVRYGPVTKFWPTGCKQKYLVHLPGSVPCGKESAYAFWLECTLMAVAWSS